jgi:hypothetical protein
MLFVYVSCLLACIGLSGLARRMDEGIFRNEAQNR